MELHFQYWGRDGQAILCLHGLFGSSSNWGTVGRRLGESFRVFAVDQRGHGQSGHATPLDYRALVDDAREFILAHGLAPAHVIGHSMGGKVAMSLASSAPTCVRSLVVVDIAPATFSPGLRVIVDALLAIKLASYASRTEVEEALAPRIADERVRRFLVSNLVRSETGGFAWRIDARAIDAYLNDLAGPLAPGDVCDRPALFLRGGKSGAIRDDDWPAIKAAFPASQLETIEAAGHWVHADAPSRFVELVERFLSRQNG